jgi:hypothetical protein
MRSLVQSPPAAPLRAADGTPTLPAIPCGCDENPIEGLERLFVDYAQGRSIAAGRDPATRPVFLRLHGVAHGSFRVNPGLPEELRVGVFGQKAEYPVWVRFSSDVQPGRPDLKGTVGIGIKLFGVEGEKVMAPDQDATTHDFILQNHDVFFVDTARDMCEFTCMSLNGKGADYEAEHPVTARVLEEMEKVVDTVLDTPYWSVLPSSFGAGRFVKYKLEPEVVPPGDGSPAEYDDPFYLAADLNRRLAAGESSFRFMVQFQTDDETMPLDRATVRWSEEASPPMHVATLVIPRQELRTRGQSAYGENLAFNSWHALPEHRPVGSIAEARQAVYRASAQARRNVNGLPVGEPVEPRPREWKADVPYPVGKDRIVRAAIHPAIGVARVGNSEEEYFIGPEVVSPLPEKPGFYRDAAGALKRQAARFRIFGYDANGQVVRELTPDTAEIRWTVHVANSKAAWYQWQMALDIPEAAKHKLPRRNAGVKEDRDALVIDGGPRSIEGRGTQGEEYRFDGAFQGTPVYLGELRTDPDGSLLFLGGLGVSASPENTPIYDEDDENSFINADGWYDDTSDGPVTAEVTIGGRQIPVDPAWVVTGPPNYAPGTLGVRTLYDLLHDLYVRGLAMPFPDPVSFRDDVYPILQRLSGLQWVNKGFMAQFGLTGPNPFEDPAYVARLAYQPAPGEADVYQELRRQVMHSFRDPEGTDNNQSTWPWLYGDAMDVYPLADSPRQNAAISITQYRVLQSWVAGKFVSDWNQKVAVPRDILGVPLARQPAMLDRAALDHCLADAFHPGCEVTWPVRHLSLYASPFRIKHRAPGKRGRDYGDELTPAVALGPRGPLHEQGPGDLTRWMGLPWQADTAFCRSGYDREYDPFIPTFWPARVPNHVLTEAAYRDAVDPQADPKKRLAAFSRRQAWVQPFASKGTADAMLDMVKIFGEMGLLEAHPGLENDPELPDVMWVASTGKAPVEHTLFKSAMPAAMLDASVAESGTPSELEEAGWGSEELRSLAPRPVRPPEDEE